MGQEVQQWVMLAVFGVPDGTGGAVSGHAADKWGACWDRVMLLISGVPVGTGSCCQ